MLRKITSASIGFLACAGLAAAQSAAYQIELDQPSYAPTEVVTLTVTGQPGVPGVILIDPVPGPVDFLDLTLDVGLSDQLVFVGVPPLGSDGQFVLPCTAPCALVETDLYAQAVSLDPATLELFPSNSVTITSPESYGFCEPCADCSGGLVSLTLRYLGDEEVFVEVYEEGEYQNDADKYFVGLVPSKGVFSLTGHAPNNKLAKSTAIAINGEEILVFDASCANPVTPGQPLGPFRVLESESQDNGPICPVDCGECKGGVISLTLQYQGTAPASIVADEKGPGGDVLFSQVVEPGQEFTLVPIDGEDLANDVEMFIEGELDVSIHTSCSEPIGPGTVWGSFVVTAAVSRDNGPICAD
ncbi:MAG: DUF7467 domain-containing protein [Planctomycetota bacterium]|jgi:hypothetical protein